MQVWFADESVPALWENSSAAAAELPAAPGVVRRSVALGRLMLDPLALLASLCGEWGMSAGVGACVRACVSESYCE